MNIYARRFKREQIERGEREKKNSAHSCVCVRARVCVCLREREIGLAREGGRERGGGRCRERERQSVGCNKWKIYNWVTEARS